VAIAGEEGEQRKQQGRAKEAIRRNLRRASQWIKHCDAETLLKFSVTPCRSGKGFVKSSQWQWQSKTKHAHKLSVFLVAGRTGFEPATGFTQHSLSRRAHSATLAPPRVQFEGSKLAEAQQVLNEPSNILIFYHATHSGGSGIRTHVGVTQTCFQDMRLRPLGHPSKDSRFYSKGGRHFTIKKTRIEDRIYPIDAKWPTN
jgi:hypothetical protein